MLISPYAWPTVYSIAGIATSLCVTELSTPVHTFSVTKGANLGKELKLPCYKNYALYKAVVSPLYNDLNFFLGLGYGYLKQREGSCNYLPNCKQRHWCAVRVQSVSTIGCLIRFFWKSSHYWYWSVANVIPVMGHYPHCYSILCSMSLCYIALLFYIANSVPYAM